MIIQTLKDIARLLQKSNIPYMVAGGQAVALYGRPRFTQDIDITVALTPAESNPLLKAVGQVFRALPEDVDKFIRGTWVLPLEHMETKVKVDITFSISPFEREAIEGSREIFIDDVPVKYIAPEHLVVQKIVAGRARDLEDATGVLEIQGDKVNTTGIEKTIKALSTGAEGREWLKRWRKLRKEI